MKKLLVVILVALTVATSADAFSLSKVKKAGGDKIKLSKCLMDEGKEQLLAGKLTKDTIKPVAKDIAATCATKLALKGSNEKVVKLATEILKKLVK